MLHIHIKTEVMFETPAEATIRDEPALDSPNTERKHAAHHQTRTQSTLPSWECRTAERTDSNRLIVFGHTE
jgi:hypothetical protein